ncbi:MAG: sigma-54-dependent Fis family transcriptional regulator [Candidatus Eisenbacteria bacterium]|nr:sigma-54-dependent Fis family transcriptional regulator [Candidatus Eisenbacteria bacterium]
MNETGNEPSVDLLMRPRIVLAAAETAETRRIARVFEGLGAEVLVANDNEVAINLLEQMEVEVLIAETRSPRVDGIRLLAAGRRLSPDLCAIFIAEPGEIDLATRAVQDGAYDYQTRPLNLDKMLAVIRRAHADRELKARLNDLQRRLDRKYGVHNILGNSAAISEVMAKVLQIAPTSASVLITGETGTGKELIATALHQNSARRNAALVKLHCGDLAAGLVESELFGHERGAFTGATSARKGRFEAADGGTLFLDAVGELPLETQAKLLRVLGSGEYQPLGSETTSRADVRIIAATSVPLPEAVTAGRFREDLYYRLAVVQIEIPALRHRRQDIPLLIAHFLREASTGAGKSVPSIAPRAMGRLLRYAWPGNVRELKNVVSGMTLAADDGRMLDVVDLPPAIQELPEEGQGIMIPIGTSLEEAEERLVEATLRSVAGDKQAASRILGVSVRTLFRHAARHREG